VTYPGEGHITIVTRLAAPLRVSHALLDEIERFVLSREPRGFAPQKR
jgi:hypothetical protein